MQRKEKPKIWEKLRVEKLSERHRALLDEFKVDENNKDEKDLKDFLTDDAINHQETDFVSRTYLVFYNPKDELIAYITLMADNIHIKDSQDAKLIATLKAKNINYKSLPALKIGRMCVAFEYRSKGVGEFLLRIAMRRILEISEHVGCRFLIADAKQSAVGFYKKFGFEDLRHRKPTQQPMYKDMLLQLEWLRDHKKTVPFTNTK